MYNCIVYDNIFSYRQPVQLHLKKKEGPLHPTNLTIFTRVGREGISYVLPPTEIGMAEPTCKHSDQKEANQSETANCLVVVSSKTLTTSLRYPPGGMSPVAPQCHQTLPPGVGGVGGVK